MSGEASGLEIRALAAGLVERLEHCRRGEVDALDGALDDVPRRPHLAGRRAPEQVRVPSLLVAASGADARSESCATIWCLGAAPKKMPVSSGPSVVDLSVSGRPGHL